MTQEELKKLLSYDPQTGVFTSLRYKCPVGTPDKDGYLKLTVKGKCFRAHRLAWLYMYGRDPDGMIDHINRIKSDNRLCNLRQATPAQNSYNAVVKNSLGKQGVNIDRRAKVNCYTARISYFDGRMGLAKRKHLGCFATAHEAQELYDLARQLVHGEFYCGRKE